MAQIASANDDRNTVVIRDKGVKGESGNDGIDGVGFDNVRQSKLSSPILKLFSPNELDEISFSDLSFTRSTIATSVNKYGALVESAIDVAREGANGWIIEGASTNLLEDSNTLTTQDVTVINQAHTLSFYGTGTVTLSGVFSGSLVGTGANDRVTLSFTPSVGTLTLTVSGSVTSAQIEALPFASSYIESSGVGVQGVRAVDISSLAALNNAPNLNGDFSVSLNIVFNGFTGGDDFVLSFPNGVDSDDATPCLFCNDGVLTFRLSDGSTSIDATQIIAANTEYLVILRKTDSSITLDVDSVGSDTQIHSLTVPTGTNGVIKFGGNESGTSKNMYGSIYNLRVYEVALNDDEVTFLQGS